uniref:FTH domain-containing protein n=2 Tax=Caenorhabditis tropicalis TaxID=1561998 RepID=A0A1I7US48_9PELO
MEASKKFELAAKVEDKVENKAEEEKPVVEVVSDEEKEDLEEDLETEPKLGGVIIVIEKTDSYEGADYDSGNEYESASEGEAADEGQPDDKENESDHSDEHAELVHWRVNFRSRNHVPSDQIAVDSVTPPGETSSDPFSGFNVTPEGEILASNFQFRHELKDSTYKNKYVLVLDSYKMRFSERDDSVLIRSDTDATVHMGISNNTLVRRNMAMEELRKLLSMNIRVWKSLFTSNRSEQMGEMDLVKFENSITAENLTINMDSYQNVVQIIKLHKPELTKFTLICCDQFAGILELEQIRKCPNLKLDGSSHITNEQILSVTATNFEITSEKFTGQGINEFLKARLATDIPAGFYARLQCRRLWEKDDVLRGLQYTRYENDRDFIKKNGPLPFNVHEYYLVYFQTNKPDERLSVLVNNWYFECFIESKKPNPICHELKEID